MVVNYFNTPIKISLLRLQISDLSLIHVQYFHIMQDNVWKRVYTIFSAMIILFI